LHLEAKMLLHTTYKILTYQLNTLWTMYT